MKTYKLEIVGFDDRELRLQLYRLAEDCQQITNRIWQLWETWHVANDSRAKIIAHLQADAEWKATKIGERPKWPVDCIPKIGGTNAAGNERNLANDISADIARNFPGVHARVRTLLENTTIGLIRSSKSARGALSAWVSILLNRQSRPSSTRVLPIPFDKANSRIVSDDKGAALFVRLYREGERKAAAFTEFRLRTTGRAARYVKPIQKIAGGAWTFKGSELFYDSRKHKWFAMVVCEMPPAEKVEAVPGRAAFLRCGYEHPIQLRIDGRRSFMRDFGRGDIVAVTRRQLITQRWTRQNNYRVAGHANKGHGRERALAGVYLLSRRWKDFTKRYNHTLTMRVVERCVAEGVETLTYFQPSGGRFLSEAGKVYGKEDSTGWDFFQIASLLAYKCQRAGVKFIPVKSGKGGSEKSSAQTVG